MLASNNIMYDRRVVRGNTYAAQVVTQSAQRESSRLRQEHERRMRLEALRRRQVKQLKLRARFQGARETMSYTMRKRNH